MRMLKLYFQKISTKVMLAMIIAFVISSLVVAKLMYKESSAIIEKSYLTINTSALATYCELLNMKQEHLVEYIRTDIMSESFIKCFSSRNRSSKPFSLKLANHSAIVEIMNHMMLMEPAITGVFYFDNYGNKVMTTNGSILTSDYAFDIFDTQPELTATVLENEGLECFFGHNVFSPNDKSNYTVIKLLRETENFSNIGILVLTVSKQMLMSNLNDSDTDDNYTIMLLDPYNGQEPVFSTDQNSDLSEPLSHYSVQADKDTEDSKYIFLSTVVSRSKWIAVSFADKSQLNATGHYIRTYLYTTLSIVILAGIAFSAVATYVISKPIKQVRLSIDIFRENHKPITDEYDNSEIGKIGYALKDAVNENIELNKKLTKTEIREKEAELLLLQAQINPHFLYNTLDTIYMLAMINDQDQIAKLTAASSDIFKISLNNGKKYLQLKDELAYIRNYMLIQESRYQNKFDFETEADETALNCFMLKLLVEPFIENAVTHGIEPKSGQGHIRFTANVWDEILYIQIIDDGVGITDLSKLAAGYGIQNVIDRIKLFYGDNYGVDIISNPGKGTKVMITIPVWPERKYDND